MFLNFFLVLVFRVKFGFNIWNKIWIYLENYWYIDFYILYIKIIRIVDINK